MLACKERAIGYQQGTSLGKIMVQRIVYGLIGLSILAFLLATIVKMLWGYALFNLTPEALSRTSNNLALIAIAITLCYKKFKE